MQYSTLTKALNKLNASVVKFDWDFNALILSAVIGEFHVALATFETNNVAKFCLSLRIDKLLEALNQINPNQDPAMELELLVVDRVIDNCGEIEQVLKIKDLDRPNNHSQNHVIVAAEIAHAETLRVFSFEDYELKLLLNKEVLARASDFGYKIKSTKKSAIEIITNKKNQPTICIPERNLNLCLDHPDWRLSVVLMNDDSVRLVHQSDVTIKSEIMTSAHRPNIWTMNFKAKEWEQVEFAAKIAAQLKVRSPLDTYLTGVEFQSGSSLRVKAFSGISVYSRQLEKSHPTALKFLISYQALYRFANLREKTDEMITLYIKDDQSFIITSESAALRGQLMDAELYPSNWHELPISRAVPAQFDDEFRKALIQVTEYQHWSAPNSAFVRLFWDDRILVMQGTRGSARIHPKNKGYDSSSPEVYVSASALMSITDQLGKKFRLAMPSDVTEMLRLSDDNTEAAVAVLYEPYYASFKKQQVSQPDQLVEETLSSNGEFECRAIEVCPMGIDAICDPEWDFDDEDPEESLEAEMLDFIRAYQSYNVFHVDDAPLVATIKVLYYLANPKAFAFTKEKAFYNDLSDFSAYIERATDIGLLLSNANMRIAEMLSNDEIIATDIQELRALWQISLNQEYWRGYQDALEDVKTKAKERNLEGYEEIIEDLKTKIPEDLPKLCDRLRVWVGRMQLESQNLVPTMQTEFRPK